MWHSCQLSRTGSLIMALSIDSAWSQACLSTFMMVWRTWEPSKAEDSPAGTQSMSAGQLCSAICRLDISEEWARKRAPKVRSKRPGRGKDHDARAAIGADKREPFDLLSVEPYRPSKEFHP